MLLKTFQSKNTGKFTGRWRIKGKKNNKCLWGHHKSLELFQCFLSLILLQEFCLSDISSLGGTGLSGRLVYKWHPQWMGGSICSCYVSTLTQHALKKIQILVHETTSTSSYRCCKDNLYPLPFIHISSVSPHILIWHITNSTGVINNIKNQS